MVDILICHGGKSTIGSKDADIIEVSEDTQWANTTELILPAKIFCLS